ncbi:gamma-butyrobetaine dioxygenase-like [Anneissia japonica]|uniref:gamma-butyrobetaine dioxygenase-like n=1 Tax=Anneissia japonica TaxID=1529436 RepID=UPI0014257C18|nr:gamma-butyrobetaine dioxygenase-like [Anneissia japonica]
MFRTLSTVKNNVKFAFLSIVGRYQQTSAVRYHYYSRLLVGKLEPFSNVRLNSSISTFEYQKLEPPTAKITSADLDDEAGMVNVTLSNNETRQYPYVWLYDNCQCDVCRNHTFSIRASCFTTLNVDVKPQHVQKMDEGLEVSWGDGHSFLFPEKWIVSHTFPATVSNEVLPWREVVEYWGNEMQNRVPTFKYRSLIESNQALNQWLEAIKVHGIALIPDAGSDIENLEKLAMRVGYPVPSNFGHSFEVPHFREPSDEPHEAAALPLHTDLAFERVPEIVMLHMVRQAGGGGSNEFVDGFNAASQLREQDPEAFHILTTTNVMSTYLVSENPSFYRSFCPVISVDDDNQIVTVRFSNHTRDPELPLPADKVKAFYKALKKFHELLSHPKNSEKIS